MQLIKLEGTLTYINEKVKELEEKMNMIVRTVSMIKHEKYEEIGPNIEEYKVILEVRKKEKVVSFLRYLKMDI